MVIITRAATTSTTVQSVRQSQLDAVQALIPTSTVSQSQLSAVQALIPTASSTAPPAVASASALGTTPLVYAVANHTHASSVQSARLAVSGGSGVITWTYPIVFAVAPICVAVPECTSGATAPFVVNVVGAPTTTSATFQVFKTAPVTLPGLATSLLGYVVNIFSAAPANTYIHVLARMPS